MVTELLQGTPAQLKARLDVLIATPKTINFVLVLADKSWYLIAYT